MSLSLCFIDSVFYALTDRIRDMIIVLFKWWYTDGWKHAFSAVLSRPHRVLEKFSVPILLGTLFEPWKQIKSYTGTGSPINDKFRVLFDNSFARTFGFFLRSNLIFIATIVAAVVFIVSFLLAILWPLLPLLPLVFLALGVDSYA